ncbi:hypothetical protein AB0E01_39395 [Nocardia vinacea]
MKRVMEELRASEREHASDPTMADEILKTGKVAWVRAYAVAV